MTADAVNILAIGDTHFRDPDDPFEEKLTITARDIRGLVAAGRVDGIVQVGDNVSAGTEREMGAYLAWRDEVLDPAVPYGEVAGNHELMGAGGEGIGGDPDIRPPSQWLGEVGRTGTGGSTKDYHIDISGRVRVLFVAPVEPWNTGVGATRRLTVDPVTLGWIADRCAEVPDMQCVVVFHAPLENTVGPVTPTYNTNSSFDERWRAHYEPGATIADTISGLPNFVAWVSGHAHARLDAERLVVPVTYGDVTFAHIAAGSPAIWHWNTGTRSTPPVCPLVSIFRDRVEVRYRNHGTRQWCAPLYTVTL